MKGKAPKRKRDGTIRWVETTKTSVERTRHGYFWKVRYPKETGGHGFKFFRSDEAERRDQFVKEQNEARELLAARDRGVLSDADTLEAAARGKKALAEHGKTVADAIEFYLEHLEDEFSKNSVTFSEVRRRFLDFQENEGTGEYHRDTLRQRTARFEESFGDRPISSITSDEIWNWINKLDVGNQTKKHFKAVLSNLFNYAIGFGIIKTSPITKAMKWKVAKSENVTLTNEQVRRIMDNTPKELRAAFTFMTFCGVRVDETKRLRWSDINWEKKSLRIAATGAKTSQGRHVEICDNAMEWLKTAPKGDGLIVPFDTKAKYDKATAKVRKAAGFKKGQYPKNGLRKTFISCHYEKHGDLKYTAKQAGNSPSVIQEHYLNLTSKKDADAFFEIRPTKKSKISLKNLTEKLHFW